MLIFIRVLLSLLFLLGLVSCSGKTATEYFLRPDVDLAYISQLAVLPFENNSRDQYAAERLRDLCITKILSKGTSDVIDKGIVDTNLKNEAITLLGENLDVATLQRLSQLMGCQAFLLGTIDMAEDVRRGTSSYHTLHITLRLVDAQSGAILWHATGSRNGDSFGSRILGLTAEDDFGVAFKLLDELLATLALRGTGPQAVPDVTQEPEEPPMPDN